MTRFKPGADLFKFVFPKLRATGVYPSLEGFFNSTPRGDFEALG